jgi:hypothetical protein
MVSFEDNIVVPQYIALDGTVISKKTIEKKMGRNDRGPFQSSILTIA